MSHRANEGLKRGVKHATAPVAGVVEDYHDARPGVVGNYHDAQPGAVGACHGA